MSNKQTWTQTPPTEPGLYWGFHAKEQEDVVLCRISRYQGRLFMATITKCGSCMTPVPHYCDWFWMGPIERPDAPLVKVEGEPLQCELPYDREKNAAKPTIKDCEYRLDLQRICFRKLKKDTEDELGKHRARLTAIEAHLSSLVSCPTEPPTNPCRPDEQDMINRTFPLKVRPLQDQVTLLRGDLMVLTARLDTLTQGAKHG